MFRRTAFFVLCAAFLAAALPCAAATYCYDFETGTIQGWTANIINDGGWPWHITPSHLVVDQGLWSLELYMANYTDAMHVWMDRYYLPPTGHAYKLTLTWRFATADWGIANLFNVIAYAGPKATGHSDFTVIGSTSNGDKPTWVWLTKKYSPVATHSGGFWAGLGVWGTWETPRTYYIDNVRVDITPTDAVNTAIPAARNYADNVAVTCTGRASTGSDDIQGRFYIEESNRTAGIAVELLPESPHVNRGESVSVTGILKTVSGERIVTYPTITVGTGTIPNPVKPLCLRNVDLGGKACGTYIPGVVGSIATNNVGLLVRTCGRVVYLGSDFFVIDDGSRRSSCGKVAIDGVAVSIDGGDIAMPPVSSYVAVTGISSTFVDTVAGQYYPLLRPRDSLDVSVASEPL